MSITRVDVDLMARAKLSRDLRVVLLLDRGAAEVEAAQEKLESGAQRADGIGDGRIGAKQSIRW